MARMPLSYDWALGRHSNIPRCCRVFYVAWWQPFRRWTFHRRPADVRDPDPRTEYVRCPACMRRGRFEPLHVCGPECPAPFTRTFTVYWDDL